MWHSNQYATEAKRLVERTEESPVGYDYTDVATVFALLAIAAAINEAATLQYQSRQVPVRTTMPKRGLFRWF